MESMLQDQANEISLYEKGRFIVGMDSVNEMLRHASIIPVSSLINTLRSHDKISSMFWLLHADLQHPQAISALEYASSMKATVEPMVIPADGLMAQSSNPSLMEQNLRRGKLFIRIKRRNGCVKSMFEEFCATNSGVKFSPVSSEDIITAQSLVPSVQFNLQLSEKERCERGKVVLPFEHQGNGAELQIYNGRRPETQCGCIDKGSGKIIYLRDSDDELADSDEDPDDDLDI